MKSDVLLYFLIITFYRFLNIELRTLNIEHFFAIHHSLFLRQQIVRFNVAHGLVKVVTDFLVIFLQFVQ